MCSRFWRSHWGLQRQSGSSCALRSVRRDFTGGRLLCCSKLFLLLLVGFLPQRMNFFANALISFLCALQVESFRKVRGSAFATTMCTGNLRSATEQWVRWRTEKDEAARRKAGRYGAIIAYFIAGAAAGVGCSGLWGERAVLASAGSWDWRLRSCSGKPFRAGSHRSAFPFRGADAALRAIRGAGAAIHFGRCCQAPDVRADKDGRFRPVRYGGPVR